MTNRRIFDRSPASWQELQTFVAQVFNEMGCIAEVGVTKDLPRGTVEIDVAVQDTTTAPYSLYICECKHWSRRVPKSVVHQFRTVVSEIGANRGFIISRAGFQAGAREAAKFTNIDLLSWTEFERIMFDRWLEAVTLRLNPLFTRAHALDDPNDADLWKGYQCTEEAWKKLHEISTRYQLITAWALLLWLSPGSLHEVVQLAVTDESGGGKPLVLDTYRKVVDNAPRICNTAYEELTAFWSRMKRVKQPRERR